MFNYTDDELIFQTIHESAPIPAIPSCPGAPDTVSVSACLTVDGAGAHASIFIGGDDPQLTPAAATALAAALIEAVRIVEHGPGATP